MLPDPASQPSPRQPLVGAALIGLALLSVFAMLHHPVAHHGDGHSHAEGIAKIAGLAGLVHGALIAMLVATALLLAEFAHARIRNRALARAGQSLYLLGTVALAGAALVNGFAAPSLAVKAGDTAGIEGALALAWQLNQALAAAGSIALALAMAVWSAGLLKRPGAERLAGAYGLLAGIALTVALASGWLRLDVRGMLATLVILAVWQAAAGALALRR